MTVEQEYNLCEAPADLFDRVMQRLTTEQRQQLTRARLWYRVGVFTVGLMSVFSGVIVLQALQAAGLDQYLALVLLDPEMVALYWQDFGMGLVESLPIMTIVLACLIPYGGMMILRSRGRVHGAYLGAVV